MHPAIVSSGCDYQYPRERLWRPPRHAAPGPRSRSDARQQPESATPYEAGAPTAVPRRDLGSANDVPTLMGSHEGHKLLQNCHLGRRTSRRIVGA